MSLDHGQNRENPNLNLVCLNPTSSHLILCYKTSPPDTPLIYLLEFALPLRCNSTLDLPKKPFLIKTKLILSSQCSQNTFLKFFLIISCFFTSICYIYMGITLVHKL